MKKLLALLFSLFLLVSLVACGPDDTPDDGKNPGSDDGMGGTIDYGPEEDPAAPDIDWDLPT